VEPLCHRSIRSNACLVCDTGTGNTVTKWSRVCSGTGMGLGWLYPSKPYPYLRFYGYYICINILCLQLSICWIVKFPYPGITTPLNVGHKSHHSFHPTPHCCIATSLPHFKRELEGAFWVFALSLTSNMSRRGKGKCFIILKINIDEHLQDVVLFTTSTSSLASNASRRGHF